MISSLSLAFLLSTTPGDAATVLTPITSHVTDDVRDAWRRPIHTDSIEAWIVSDRPLTSKMVGSPEWKPPTVDDSGGTTIPRGGWGLFVFESDETTPAILDASAFGDAWINGLPRGGDIYGKGRTRLPFLLRKGRNEILFLSGRGTPAPTVTTARELARTQVSPGAPRVALLGGRDRTLPDAIADEPLNEWAAILVYNVDTAPLRGGHVEAESDGMTTITPVPTIPPLSFLKVPVRLQSPVAQSESTDIALRLRSSSGDLLDTDSFSLRVRNADQWRKHTFKSDIDGSVQYYGLVPAVGDTDELPGTVLSLHGASVEGGKQASCYKPRDWCMVVAPTNRRPFGFDWEEWGRLDALEVLADARRRYPNDPSRTWLTGHSMGGHGTWNLGLTRPADFAAIAPSAGWASFWTYGGPERYADNDGIDGLLRAAANPSDTNLLLPNADRLGIYILHGEADDNVPVTEARAMREKLGASHGDFAYYERPGAGHWWGDQCMDWPPLFEFLRRHARGAGGHRDQLTFITVDPASSASCDWATIEQQAASLRPSRIDLQVTRSGEMITIDGTTENVTRLSIDTRYLDFSNEEAVQITLDGSPPISSDADTVQLARSANGGWTTANPISPDEKNPARGGRLRSAWNHGITLIVGTSGSNEETAWNRARARQDAERWWYRGNGVVEIVDDVDFNAATEPNRGIMLYGNRDTNSAWNMLLTDSPIQVERNSVVIGERTIDGDVAVAFVRPRPGSDVASVATIAGTAGAGERSTATMPLFFPGVGWPDWMVVEPASLTIGDDGIVGLGFFGNDWKIDPAQSAWREPATTK
ncbi:MAG: prolyl oligopeptidase family serine peptidase [Phycisphaerales bacterium]|nr:prolyl oligopeptidase family serine peptidase [Phycisphaerales bacterium]